MAVSKCRKLHRDLSAWNILIDPDSKRGLLTDWDLCAPMPSAEACEEDPSINPLAQIPNSSGRPDRTYMPVREATAIAIVDELLLSYTFRGGVPVGGDTKRSFLSGSGNFKLELSPDTTRGWLKYQTALERYTPDPLLDDVPPAPTDLCDYDKLDATWRRILDQGVFMDNDRLNDPDHTQDPFHVSAVYRRSLEMEADKQVELQTSAQLILAESQRTEAEARQAEMQRANPKTSIDKTGKMKRGKRGPQGAKQGEERGGLCLTVPFPVGIVLAGRDAGMCENGREEAEVAAEAIEEDAGRAAKRQKTNPDRSGTTSPDKLKNSTQE
ncbi:uncharacterized protein SCHCODRAFT_01340842 [Schizophyllum commune H4-8]|nr:uncharacterized protein SCHCODRAFT_01340842 [Schizophyllum commune H4-8]KAI5886003.1 hypothetical protein SCHCODRAFT_01340842 [Schizophyllum commune H4-8]